MMEAFQFFRDGAGELIYGTLDPRTWGSFISLFAPKTSNTLLFCMKDGCSA